MATDGTVLPPMLIYKGRFSLCGFPPMTHGQMRGYTPQHGGMATRHGPRCMGYPTYRNGGTPHSNNICPRNTNRGQKRTIPGAEYPRPNGPDHHVLDIDTISVGFWNMRRNGSAMDIKLQRAAELNLDIFFLGEAHLDKDRNGELQVKGTVKHQSGKRCGAAT